MNKLERVGSSEYDIVIVGAGPAGCSVANFLKKDFRVLIVDGAKFPRSKPCGGLLTDESQEFLRKLKLPSSVISQPKRLDLEYIDWENNLDVRQKKDYLNIDREKFDYALLELATQIVDFSPDTKFLSVSDNGNGLKILLKQNNKELTVKSKYLVGADGALSSVRNIASDKKIPRYVAVQEWMNNGVEDNGHHSDFVYILCNEITDFYSWIIPKKDQIIIGAAIPFGVNTSSRFHLLKQKIKEKMHLEIKAHKKEACLLTRPASTNDVVLGKKNIFLVGEAAGFISPSTGDGISFALRSGYNCAHALNNCSSGSVLDEYEKLSEPLIKEISEKLEKANILSDPKKRLNLLEKLKGM